MRYSIRPSWSDRIVLRIIVADHLLGGTHGLASNYRLEFDHISISLFVGEDVIFIGGGITSMAI